VAFMAVGWKLHQELTWVKNSMVLGHSDYHYRHEPILYGYKVGKGRVGRGNHAGSKWYGDHSQTSVFEVDKPPRSSEHPTMKPVALITPMLLNSSKPGDTVLDVFGGSGSTLIAAEMLGRSACLMEIDPRYCDVIRRRYEAYISQNAVAA
jgi:DNA modification methylase